MTSFFPVHSQCTYFTPVEYPCGRFFDDFVGGVLVPPEDCSTHRAHGEVEGHGVKEIDTLPLLSLWMVSDLLIYSITYVV